MPNATVDPTDFEHKELKSLADAWVNVRPLPYGMVLQRRDKASKMYMEANPGKSRAQAAQEMARFEIETMNEWATLFDYKYCIVDHNLEDKNGNKLDMGSPLVLKQLMPKVGAELDQIISELNDLEEDEDFTTLPSGTSPEGQNGSGNQSLTGDLVNLPST
jgi:hypothetical protein